MNNVKINMIEQQTETIRDVELSEEQQKAYLYQYHPDIYKKLYPDQVIKKHIPEQPKSTGDSVKSNDTYRFDRYGSSNITETDSFEYKVTITTDMKL